MSEQKMSVEQITKELDELERKAALFDEMVGALEELLDMHLEIDTATIPRGGIEIAPDQVVYNASIGYLRIKRAKSILDKVKT